MTLTKVQLAIRTIAALTSLASFVFSGKLVHAQMNICVECVEIANNDPDNFLAFQRFSVDQWGSVLHFSISPNGAMFLGQKEISSEVDVLDAVFRAYLSGDSTNTSLPVEPISRSKVERAKGGFKGGFDLLRITKNGQSVFFPWDDVLDLPSVGPISQSFNTPRILFSESVSPRFIRDLLMGLGSVLEELRSELCEEIVGLTYDEVFAEVQTSPESIYSNVLEYTWQCYPAIKVDRNKYANPEFLSRQDFSDTPYMIVEKMPALEPCIDLRGDERTKCTQEEIISYISRNVEYPAVAKDAGVQGTVFVYFIVGKNGEVRDVKVLREVDPRLDEEAVRVVESLPVFEPGQQRGNPVSVQFTIPVKFIAQPMKSEGPRGKE